MKEDLNRKNSKNRLHEDNKRQGNALIAFSLKNAVTLGGPKPIPDPGPGEDCDCDCACS